MLRCVLFARGEVGGSGLLMLVSVLLLMAGLGAEELPRGRIIEKVVCRADSQQSYAVFLPSHYTGDREWPILYCFDPAARGRVPVERFQEAAEKYGYIVAGSNNSRNGPFEVSLAATDAMWYDTHARFRIDARRVYATGFSGGARVACRMGLAGELVAGVIASSGGFPGGETPKSVPFVFFGTAGTEDFNLSELKQLDGELDSLKAAHRVVIFEGGHDWPSAALCMEAIEWMEIQAIKAGRRPKDEALVDALLKRRRAGVQALEAAGDALGSWRGYAALAADFKGLREVAEFENKAAEAKDSRRVRASLKKEQEEERRYGEVSGELYSLKEALKDPEERPGNLGLMLATVARLRRKAEAKDDSAERRVARRVLQGTYVRAYEQARDLRERKNYTLAALELEVVTAIRPERPLGFYDLAATYALAGDKKRGSGESEEGRREGLQGRGPNGAGPGAGGATAGGRVPAAG